MADSLFKDKRQMGLKYIPIPRDPLDMTRAEIKECLDGADWSILMRSILVYEIKRVQAIRQRGETIENRTLRSLWYTLIKPTLDRLGALEPSYYTRQRVRNEKDIGKVPDWDGKASKYLAELVEAGFTSYEELGIIDGSRQRRSPMGQSLTINDVDIIGVHYPNIILFTEKDTIYQVIESIAAIYGISVLSGAGQPSYAATENLIRKMAEHEKFVTGSNIYILTLTDYDPAGYTISQSVIDQVTKVANTLPDVGDVIYERLGLEPEQLTGEERERNTYTPAPTGLDKWFEQTGGVNGQPLGLELDALPLSRIRALFVEGIQKVIDSEELYHTDLANALVDMLVWEVLKPKIDELRADLKQKADADSLAAGLTCASDIVAQFARAGLGHIDPLRHDEYVFKAAAEIRNQLKEFLT